MGVRALGWGVLAGMLGVIAFQGGTHQPRVATPVAASTAPPVLAVEPPSTTVTEPVLADPAPPAPATAIPIRTVWDDLADCLPDTGRGRLDWVQSIWNRHRGDAPVRPADATWAEEMAAGERLLIETGGRYLAWVECARQLGLPT